MAMTAAEEALKDGRLEDARVQLQEQVKKSPADAKLRVFLFQLSAVTGQWERALTQLNVCGDLDAGNLAMVQAYREAIRCELLREKVFRGETSPLVFGEPQQWVALLIEAAKLSTQGHFDQAANLRVQAFEQAPATSGVVNDDAFEWIADSDGRLGPVLEAIVNGRYFWIPFSQIASIETDPPTDLRDLVWTPAQFTWANQGTAVGFIPTRYPGSDQAADPQVRLARKTEWLEPAPEFFTGLGQRVLTTDGGDVSLFEIRKLVLNTQTGSPNGGTDA